jgi:hypothetical protein
MGFARFMSSMSGRIVRILAGLALVLLGALVIKGSGGVILAIIGLVPLVAGAFNFCVFAPLFGGPLLGKDVRQS